ncbi:TPA: ANR family transcriptional regulator [Pasteurella multocida]|uniref:ANR family transcriptional regulator n=1 Tax=Pasteurella multocida TaxID=747 RepID=UPI0029AF0E24|nr:ANR family transcriptional regulator [Pasteurella multocida]MEB4587003.1 ANR family transcriptional regulator [Pasteurella multocida]HEH9717243.1 ANR family transcriptional regulator [Pasteurella multocida]HEH9728185.1 ANR family transcriptional regulator [Pasteurella multocida]HEH9735312.1 ANR family transcriptional regulator [Pasteurella multocida]HEH9766919.1 ANR family transcriptional regulator [Pasteurella multocida]
MAIKKFNRFTYWSDFAANAERNKGYKQASKAWEVASLNASPLNKKWCKNRKAFCDRMTVKPF